MKLLFVGEGWKGSSARSMREGLAEISGLDQDDIVEDLYMPRGRSPLIRACNRIMKPVYIGELGREILLRLRSAEADVLVVYKGNLVAPGIIRAARARGIITVNIFPDFSPHRYGPALREAMGEYDLVISTKPFHPGNWKSVYGYANECVFVPHGYDELVHFWGSPVGTHTIDVAMAASWRPEYERLLIELADRLRDKSISISIAGNAWERSRNKLPKSWEFHGGLYGRAYGSFLRRAKIVIAPVNREVFIDGRQQPGDEDTTRTYELAAAWCFFLHRRTPYVKSIFDEELEVPMWSDASELAELIDHFLPRSEERARKAAAAHRRAVPNYSTKARAMAAYQYILELTQRK